MPQLACKDEIFVRHVKDLLSDSLHNKHTRHNGMYFICDLRNHSVLVLLVILS